MHKGGTGETAQRDLVKHRLNDALWRFRMLSTNELGSATEFDDPNENFSQWSLREEVFSITVATGEVQYPAFQFQRDNGKPWPSIASVLPRLHKEMNAADIFIWFDSPHPALRHRKPIDYLDDAEALQRAVRYTCEDQISTY